MEIKVIKACNVGGFINKVIVIVLFLFCIVVFKSVVVMFNHVDDMETKHGICLLLRAYAK